MREKILVIKQGAMSEEAEEKLQAMRMIGINIGQFIEWAILNFDIDVYLKVMQCKQLQRIQIQHLLQFNPVNIIMPAWGLNYVIV